jgi:DNA polymerase III alpha subunit
MNKDFKTDTLTLKNLTAIYEAMSKIKEIDQSEYFKQYLKEVQDRIKETKALIEAKEFLIN